MNLAAEMAKLPYPPDGEWPDWGHWRQGLWRRAQSDPPETYTSWHVVHHNFLSSWLDISDAWEMLDMERHGPAIRHAPIEPDDNYRGCSRHLAKIAGWLSFWEKSSGRTVDTLTSIYEFGAGLGALCLVARRLGFTGRYMIYDFPEMQVFQRWWLEREGVAAEFVRQPEPADLFVALSSLSETYPAFRDTFPVTASNYLIEWQEEYDWVDNRAWFADFFKRHGGQWAHYKERQESMWLSAGWT